MPWTILHTECSTGWGGQEIRIFSEMEAMQKRGHYVLLAAPERSTICKRCRDAGFPVFAFHDEKWRYPVAIMELARLFRRQKVQIVNTHSSRDGWIGGLAARLARVPLIIRSRHIDVTYPNRFLSRIAYGRLPHLVLTTSNKITDGLLVSLDLNPAKVITVPTGVDLKKFHPDVKSDLRKELGMDPNVKLIGMASVLRSWKGHYDFLIAARAIAKKYPSVRFVIAGDGPMKETVIRQIEELELTQHVSLLGHRNDVPQVLAALDIVVLPSTAHEGIPQTMLQAMAMGKPVIGTRVGGIPEVIEDGWNGLLVPSRDAAAIAQAALRLIDNHTLRDNLTKKARETILQRHSLDTMCETLEGIYASHLPS
ncbi:MAG: glycosyltransferase [bacterium]